MSNTPPIVWDAHLGFEPAVTADLTRLERFRRAGVGYLSVNVGYDRKPWADTFKVIGTYAAWIDAHPDGYVLARSVDDVEAATATGRLALGFDLEGMGALDGDVSLIGVYHAIGVNQMAFAYNRGNAFGGGCHDDDVGLTDLGRHALAEMNHRGIIVDCSHCSPRTSLEAMELSSAPVIFSHSNPAGVQPHGRNISDEQIRACAATGGVVGVNGIGLFLGDPDAATATMVKHIRYVADLVGTAHVGLGLDATFDDDLPDGVTADRSFWPPGHGYERDDYRCAEPEQIPQIAEALATAGYAQDEVEAIMGRNFRRVASHVWR